MKNGQIISSLKGGVKQQNFIKKKSYNNMMIFL